MKQQTTEKRKFEQKQLNVRRKIEETFREMFENTCQAIESLDGKSFTEHVWARGENGGWMAGKDHSNIYIDRVLQQGNVFEKIGVNYVAIEGELPPGMTFQMSGALTTTEADHNVGNQGTPYFATGTSFVIHPINPMAPIAHVNYRYFQVGDGTRPGSWWFGGGADLTPAYLFEEDVVHFHQVHQSVCDKHDPTYYARFKQWCDEYFYIPHRAETRGVGGIFFDHLNDRPLPELLSFVTDCTEAFIPAYLPLVRKRKDTFFTDQNKYWQRIVRGRYVEFILTADRGIRFGLSSGMVNQQSVFNCMPPAASWQYNDQPVADSDEAKLKEILKQPRKWVEF